MRLHSFQELVTRIAHLSTRSGKPIRIIFGKEQAAAAEGVVYLPVFNAGTVLTTHEFNVLFGIALHETYGHQAHTDLPLYIKTVTATNDPVFSQVLNICEDIYCENADLKLYPGDRKYLDAAHQFMDDKVPVEKCQNPSTLGLVYKEAFTKYRNLDTKRIQGQLEGPIVKAMRDLLYCQSTSDCISLARKITELLKEEPQDDRSSSESDRRSEPIRGDSSEGDSPDPSDPRERTPGTSANHGLQDQTLSSSRERLQDDEQGDPTAKEDLSSSAQDWNALTEIKNLIQEIAQAVRDTNHSPGESPPHGGFLIIPPCNISQDRIFVPSEEDMETYLSVRNQLAPQILALKKMFRIHLQARSRKSWLRGLEDGEVLDRERLHVIPSGQKSIFKDKRDRQLIDTAVELMVDLSSSMSRELTQSAAIVLAEALSTIAQIKLSICGFTARHDAVRPRFGYGGRADPMDILLFKDYLEPFIKSRAKLGGMRTDGSTPLGCAYGKALERILSRPEPRRVIFLVTDGQPSFSRADYRHSDYLLMANIHKKCQRLGIETLGLGIGSDSVQKYTDKFVRIASIETLPQTLMQVLKGAVR